MPKQWELARDALARDPRMPATNYVTLRLEEIRLEILAEKIHGSDHFFVITAPDHFAELCVIVRLVPQLPLVSWDEFRATILREQRDVTNRDRADFDAYVAAQPYDVMKQSHAPTSIIF